MKRAKFKHCDHRETLYSKGDVRRPEERDKFLEGWDRIFGDYKKGKAPKREDAK